MILKTTQFDVSIIIVGLNAKNYVLDCMKSIFDANWQDVSYEVIYIDNGSTDSSVEAVESSYTDTIKVKANKLNLGYCPAANQGATMSSGRYLYFINDDTLVIDDAIALIVNYMDENPDVGTAGSRLIYPNGDEQYSGRMFPDIFSSIFGRRSVLARLFPNIKPVSSYLCKKQLEQKIPFEVDWVSAAGQIVRAEDFTAVGGFAEDYYYWHEAVFCHRLEQIDKRIILHPESVVIHYEGQGSGARPLKSQRFHIIDFHLGAIRAYAERYSLGQFSPTRLLVTAALLSRAFLLLTQVHLKHFFNSSIELFSKFTAALKSKTA